MNLSISLNQSRFYSEYLLSYNFRPAPISQLTITSVCLAGLSGVDPYQETTVKTLLHVEPWMIVR